MVESSQERESSARRAMMEEEDEERKALRLKNARDFYNGPERAKDHYSAPEEFPDVSLKLSAPKRISAFERDRQAAKAKEQRAKEENEAALKKIRDEFGYDDDDGDIDSFATSRGPPSGPRAGLHTSTMPPSGPKGFGMSNLQEPPNLKRKRALDQMREDQAARGEHVLFDRGTSAADHGNPLQASDPEVEQEAEAPRPTLHLSNMLPGTDELKVRKLLEPALKVHSVQILAISRQQGDNKRSISAMAMLDSQTNPQDIDATVRSLSNKYLGRGLYLKICPHLSSTSVASSMMSEVERTIPMPFGAGKLEEPSKPSFRSAPPPGQMTFAPPGSSSSMGAYGMQAPAPLQNVVQVEAPLDIQTTRAIHTMVEALTIQENPHYALELEAAIMAISEIEQDERFAWLYDSKSPAGVYYRYLLWGPEDEDEDRLKEKRRAETRERVYDDIDIDWLPPYGQLPFMDLATLADAVDDIDYISSEDEADREVQRRFNGRRKGGAPLSFESQERQFMTPLNRAKLTHLLSRLPTSTPRIRRGDLARVTDFAIDHAGEGADEIVDLLLLNVEKPLSSSLAAKFGASDSSQSSEDEYEPHMDLTTYYENTSQPPKDAKPAEDPSNPKLVALYCICDLMAASAVANARSAWKYRTLFEAGFQKRKIFEHLGRLDKELGWGRMKREKWQLQMKFVFETWDRWSAFTKEGLAALKKSFFEPPLSKEEQAAKEKELERQKKVAEERAMGKFKQVGQAEPAAEDVDGEPMEDVDGESMEDVDGEPMDDELDGQPMMEDVDGRPMEEME
ncbi:hypothetical protein B0A50_04613 [Salinomyces thailandicus]|uniref:CID domain-containing protein n=1 Tax=Salinomyces thailandicus TaxID=706561 RepID=A0A4U0TV69_9PEZI|nr:hypothetical protein B0A50_04613 [Salinomyces thailandica]